MCVMPWVISFASLEQVVTPLCPLSVCPSVTGQGWALVTNSHVGVPCLSFPVCKTEIILPSLPPFSQPALGHDLSFPQNLTRTCAAFSTRGLCPMGVIWILIINQLGDNNFP